ASDGNRADRVDRGLQAQAVQSRGELHVAGADALPFGGELHLGLRRTGRFHRDVDGKTLATEDLAGNGDRLQTQLRFGTAGERNGVDGDAELPRLPDGARHAAQIFVTVGDEKQPWDHARG